MVRLKRLASIVAVCAVMALAVLPRTAAADADYGVGSYGNCAFDDGCSVVVVPPASPELPALEVVVNLIDGQVITDPKYVITITPKGGQTVGLASVGFYLGGQFIDAAVPDVSGVVSLDWDTHLQQGSPVVLVITDTNDSSITQTYHVTIRLPREQPSSSGGGGTNAPVSPPSGFAGIDQSITQFVNKLPKPFVRAFPYALFAVLLANLLLLLVQLLSEVRAYRQTKALLERKRELADSKRALISLISHYLRTPITILMGGIDMLTGKTQEVMLQAQQSLSGNIENLIDQTRAQAGQLADAPEQTAAPHVPFWRRGMFVPIVLIGVFVLVFDALTRRATKLEVSQTTLLTHAFVFCGLATFTYITFRSVQLHRRHMRDLQQVAEAEAALVRARDGLVAETATLLRGDIKQLGAQLQGLPAGQAKDFITEGYDRFVVLLQKFELANSIRDAHVAETPTTMQLSQLTQTAWESVAKAANTKGVKVSLGVNQLLRVRDPQLLTEVIATLLDNAVAYSPDGGTVEVTCQSAPNGTAIHITDHGSGIPADKLSELFSPFQKLEGSDTFTHEGMGFSLYLDRLIMLHLNGSIQLTTPTAGGTTATINLPAAS